MKAEVNREILSKRLTVLSTVLNAKSALPIIQQVLFEPRKGKLVMSATNLEVSVDTFIDFNLISGEETSFVIPVESVMKTIENLKSENVWFEVSKSKFEFGVSNSKKKYQIGIEHEANDFPHKKTSADADIVLRKEYILPALINASESTDKKDIRTQFQGVHIQKIQDKIRIAGITGIMFFVFDIDYPEAIFEEVIIPTDAISVLRQLSGLEFKFGVNKIDNAAIFNDGEYKIIAQTLQGKTPAIENIIGGISTKEKFVRIEKTELTSCLKRVAAFKNFNSHMIVLNLGSEESVSVTAENIDFAKQAWEEIPTIEKKDMTHSFGINHNLLEQAVKSLPGKEIKISQTEESKIVVIEDETSQGSSNMRYYISPMRVNS